MSINRLFEISKRALQAQNARMEATGQNIGNADSEGYHRRRVTLNSSNTVSPGLYTSSADLVTGDGVSIESYERVRDRLLDSAAAEAKSGESGAREESRILTVLEGALATETEGSLQTSMDKFWKAWDSVASDPTDDGVRSALLGRADSLTSSFHRIDDRMSDLVADTKTNLSSSVEKVNGLLDEMAQLNQRIREARSSGSPDFAAKDRRDAVVKELSTFVPVQVQEKETGYSLTIDGMNVVQGNEATHLTRPDAATVEIGDTGVAFDGGSEGRGKIGAQLRMLNTTLPDVQSRLDGLAKKVVEKVNSIHETGYDQNDNTNISFFDPAGTTAGTIQQAVTSTDEVAAVAGPDSTGDTTPAQNIAALSESLTPEAIDLAAHVGSEVQRAAAQEESKAAMVEHLEGAAQGVSGVSMDEEMSDLIAQQQAFSASARVLRTAREVTDTLLSI